MAENVLGTIFSRADALKRQLYDMIRNPSDYASMVGGRTQENMAAAQALQNQAFADPQNPLRITNPQALNQLTQMITSGPLGFAPAGITAFHGSPYLFRQFDRAKIGSGEGAQVYGVGAGYTAEARPVAETYREQISKNMFETGDKNIFDPSKLEHLNVRVRALRGDLEGAIKKAEEVISSKSPSVDLAARDLSVLRSLQELGGIKPTEGYLYKGDIPDEILPKFLDWDKPLSEQSKQVKDALARLPHRSKEWTFKDTIESIEAAPYLKNEPGMNPTGQEIYNMLGQSSMVGNMAQGQKEATDTLEKLGIRGIRYADEGSRGKYKAQTTYKGEPYSDVLTFYDKKQLDDFVKEKEAEGFGVKTFPQTSNFIPFRAEDYKIQEINDTPIEDYIAKGLL